MAYKTVSPHQPFEYGSAVRVRITPNPYALVQGSVSGFTKIEDPEAAKKRGAPIGTVYLLVEDESGAAIEISADHLELIPTDLPLHYLLPHAYAVCEQIFRTGNGVKDGDTLDVDGKNVFKIEALQHGFFGKTRALQLSWIAASNSFDPKQAKN